LSLEGFEFQKFDRIKYDIVGTGMAFRYWNTIDWFPNIYVNVVIVVCKNPWVIEFVKKVSVIFIFFQNLCLK